MQKVQDFKYSSPLIKDQISAIEKQNSHARLIDHYLMNGTFTTNKEASKVSRVNIFSPKQTSFPPSVLKFSKCSVKDKPQPLRQSQVKKYV